MESFIKGLEKIIKSSKYQFEFYKDNYPVCYLVFMKSLSDLTKAIANDKGCSSSLFSEMILPIASYKYNIGEDLNKQIEVIINGLTNLPKYEVPDFMHLNDSFLVDLLLLLDKHDFSKGELFEGDVLSKVYEHIGLIFFKKSPYLSNAEFLTPKAVCDVLSMLTSNNEMKDGMSVCDPCCGTGSTLVSFMMKHWEYDLVFYGQDINLNSVNICKINIYLHKVKVQYLRASIEK
jgi:type I restriction-modification system DNA methylase subunit